MYLSHHRVGGGEKWCVLKLKLERKQVEVVLDCSPSMCSPFPSVSSLSLLAACLVEGYSSREDSDKHELDAFPDPGYHSIPRVRNVPGLYNVVRISRSYVVVVKCF